MKFSAESTQFYHQNCTQIPQNPSDFRLSRGTYPPARAPSANTNLNCLKEKARAKQHFRKSSYFLVIIIFPFVA